VRFSGGPQQLLLDIRNGHFAYDELTGKAEVLMQRLEQFHAASDLPEKADAARAESLLREVTASWEERHTGSDLFLIEGVGNRAWLPRAVRL